MCGFLGVLTSGYADSWVQRVVQCRGMIAPRGPDDSGIWSDRSVVLMHQRLAIIDPSEESNQPLCSDDGRYALAFNGEIYNYLEFAPSSRGDTHSLLAGDPWALRPGHLRGMFAYALWDRSERELTLVRDRFGMKPLYYAVGDGVLAFGSSATAVAVLVGRSTISRASLAQYLRYGSVWSGESIYGGVSEVSPGAMAVFSEQRRYTRRYWSLPEPERPLQDTVERSIKLSAVLEESVRAHLTADVPVGLFLSAGFDSGVLASILATAPAAGVRVGPALTLSFPGEDIDESREAALTAERYGLAHVLVDDLTLPTVVESFLSTGDQPSVDGLNTFMVSRAASAFGLKVALTGLGADEFLGGYANHRRIPLIYWAGRFSPEPLLRFVLSNQAQNQSKVRELSELRNPRLSDVYSVVRSLMPQSLVYRLSGELPLPVELDGPESPALDVARLEIENYMRFTLLRDADTYGMANSIELRMPFVDHVFWEAIARRRWRVFVNRKRSVGPLESHLRTRLARPKTGFSVPLGSIIRNHLMERLAELDRGPLSSLLDVGQVKLLRTGFLRTPSRNDSQIWALICLDSWARRTGVG